MKGIKISTHGTCAMQQTRRQIKASQLVEAMKSQVNVSVLGSTYKFSSLSYFD